MYQFNCKDMGLPNLDPKVNHVVTGNTVDEVMKKTMEHARAHHADLLKSMSSQQMAEMEKTIKSKITTKA